MTKPEPYALLPDSEALRLREKLEGASAQVRFLTGRVVGAPEAVFYLFGFPMKKGEEITHLTTLPPSRRRRALAARPKAAAGGPAEEEAPSLRFADGAIEQYVNRPTDITPAERLRGIRDPGAPPAVALRGAGIVQAEAPVVRWVECEQCGKWRVLATGAPPPSGAWRCDMNTDPLHNTCNAAEQDEAEVATAAAVRVKRMSSDIKWNEMLYPDFHRNFEVRRTRSFESRSPL